MADHYPVLANAGDPGQLTESATPWGLNESSQERAADRLLTSGYGSGEPHEHTLVWPRAGAR